MNTDAEILKALRKAGGGSVSGAELSASLGISRAAIWARIEELRRLGYDIEASPHSGYRLLDSPDLLHAEDLVSRMPSPGVIGRDIHVFQETTSTNDIVEKLARDGAKEGVVVFAESQTKGRGRLGRNWVSPVGKGLWFSVLLRPNLRPQQATQLTVASATALRRAIEAETGLATQIKWPNDIVVRQLKVAGILTELSAEPDRVLHLILGIGIDVNLAEDDFPANLRRQATSLMLESSRAWDRAELAARVLQELDADYARIRTGSFQDVAEEWQSHCITLGREVTITMGTRQIRGRAESLDDDGALIVRSEYGHLERITGGDVTLDK